MKDLINDVAVKISWLWDQVGIQLDVPYEELKGYQERNSSASSSKMFTFVFTTWRSRQTSEYTWTRLIAALGSPTVSLNRLADELTEKLTVPQDPQ